MCSEGLSALINAFEEREEIHGISVTKGGLSINHLLFANDNFIFCLDTLEEWARVANLLKVYERG